MPPTAAEAHPPCSGLPSGSGRKPPSLGCQREAAAAPRSPPNVADVAAFEHPGAATRRPSASAGSAPRRFARSWAMGHLLLSSSTALPRLTSSRLRPYAIDAAATPCSRGCNPCSRGCNPMHERLQPHASAAQSLRGCSTTHHHITPTRQGILGDCWFLSAVAVLARKSAADATADAAADATGSQARLQRLFGSSSRRCARPSRSCPQLGREAASRRRRPPRSRPFQRARIAFAGDVATMGESKLAFLFRGGLRLRAG